MKNQSVLKCMTLFAIIMFFVCAAPLVYAQIPDVLPSPKEMARRFLTHGKVEVVTSQMEKIEGLGEGFGGIRITGTAIYTPARIGRKPFSDLLYDVRFKLLDDAGKTVRKTSGSTDSGQDGQEENVEFGKEFPFVYEDVMIPLDQLMRITAHEFDVWWILQ